MKKVKQKRKPQDRGLKTRERILEVAMDCLVDDNIHGLRFSHIAKKAKVAQPLMDYHFPNLEALLMEMVLLQVEKLRQLSTDAIEKNLGDPKKTLSAYIQAPFLLAEGDARFRAVWSCLYHLASVNPRFSNLNIGFRKIGRERITTLIKANLPIDAAKGKKMQDRIDSAALAIQGLITGLSFMAGTDPAVNYRDFSRLASQVSQKIIDEILA